MTDPICKGCGREFGEATIKTYKRVGNRRVQTGTVDPPEHCSRACREKAAPAPVTVVIP